MTVHNDRVEYILFITVVNMYIQLIIINNSPCLSRRVRKSCGPVA